MGQVKHKSGYMVAMGRSAIEYEEDNKLLKIPCEVILTPSGFDLNTKSIKKWTEPEEIPISEKERIRIVKNVIKALKYMDSYVETNESNQKSTKPVKAKKGKKK